ncbi:hypothetical protein Nepgr_003540 [Nepenthes gracilis]|uniref:BHLH domain-containing protein n=1 Tax=Nepenthes gracilis TaxID=150966 RepID=A0AAD3RZP9_NEPGR|nr:hypothetical protein Nepgr_003540 [Nepenthes gracilis]
MSSRRSRSTQSGGSGISDEQISDLVSKLQQLIPELRRRRTSDKLSASSVLQETCNYIRNLHREVDDLSERLSQLLDSTDSGSAQAEIIRSLLISLTLFRESVESDAGEIEFRILLVSQQHKSANHGGEIGFFVETLRRAELPPACNSRWQLTQETNGVLNLQVLSPSRSMACLFCGGKTPSFVLASLSALAAGIIVTLTVSHLSGSSYGSSG